MSPSATAGAAQITEIINRRRISDVLHFTTNKGLTGIIFSGVVHPRSRLAEDKYVEHVVMPNCERRYDPEHLGYVNLSLSRINITLFNISSKKWHWQKNLWWCILSFRPEILTHEGVIFTTTNNKYHDAVLRARGAAGLEQMFAPSVREFNKFIVRGAALPDHFATARQAEVLYHGDLSIDFLQKVYVASDQHGDIAAAVLDAAGRDVEIDVRPDMFSS